MLFVFVEQLMGDQMFKMWNKAQPIQRSEEATARQLLQELSCFMDEKQQNKIQRVIPNPKAKGERKVLRKHIFAARENISRRMRGLWLFVCSNAPRRLQETAGNSLALQRAPHGRALRATVAIGLVALLPGCAQWNQLSEGEKTAVIVSGAILVGANLIKNSSGDTIINKTCVSTQSIKTGCGDVAL